MQAWPRTDDIGHRMSCMVAITTTHPPLEQTRMVRASCWNIGRTKPELMGSLTEPEWLYFRAMSLAGTARGASSNGGKPAWNGRVVGAPNGGWSLAVMAVQLLAHWHLFSTPR